MRPLRSQHDSGADLRGDGWSIDTGEIAFGAPELCHTEVEDFDAPVAGKKNVFRLEVAVEDAFIMCCNQPPNNLERVICRSAGGHRTRLNPLAKRLTFQKFRH